MKKLSDKAVELYEAFKNKYIEYGYMYSGNIIPTTESLNVFEELEDAGFIQRRKCQLWCYELTQDQRKSMILENDLHKAWEEKASYFYPNREGGEIVNVFGYSL